VAYSPRLNDNITPWAGENLNHSKNIMTFDPRRGGRGFLVVTNNQGAAIAVKAGSRRNQLTRYDDGDYDCACCIGGFSK